MLLDLQDIGTASCLSYFQRIADFDTQRLGNTARVFSTVGFPQAELFAVSAKAAEPRINKHRKSSTKLGHLRRRASDANISLCCWPRQSSSVSRISTRKNSPTQRGCFRRWASHRQSCAVSARAAKWRINTFQRAPRCANGSLKHLSFI